MKKEMLLGLLTLALLGTAQAGSPPSTQINYQGVLRDADDRPLTGSYNMIFRFFDADVGGAEIMIDTHAAVSVSGGLFSVKLGGSGAIAEGVISDGSGPGRYTYPPNVFRDYNELFLEVEVEGEVLSPRTKIVAAGHSMNARYVNGVNVAYDWAQNFYVDSVLGDDDNSGIFSHSPKKTIQAAIDGVPFILGGDVTINIADGTYHEEVFIGRRLRAPDSLIRLIGNVGAPANVVLDGQGSLSNGMQIFDIVEIGGITITGYIDHGVEFVDAPQVDLHDCVISGNGLQTAWIPAALMARGSALEIRDCAIDSNQHDGIRTDGSRLLLSGVSMSGNGASGLFANNNSAVEVGSSGVQILNNSGSGVRAEKNSTVEFYGNSSISFQNNSGGDMRTRQIACILGYGNGTSADCAALDAHSMCVP